MRRALPSFPPLSRGVRSAWHVLASFIIFSRIVSAQEILLVDEHTLAVRIKASGTVAAANVFRLRSAGDGRIETVDVSSGQWAPGSSTLATMADTDMSALMDSRSTTPKSILKDRWRSVYQAAPIECRKDCFILKVYVSPQETVKAHAVLFEAARRLVMSGRIVGDASRFARDGQTLAFWPQGHPESRRTIELSGYKAPPEEETSSAALEGVFSRVMPETNWLAPDTSWEGTIVADSFQDPLAGPGGSLVCMGEEAFFAVSIPTGTMTLGDMKDVKMRVQSGKLLLGRDRSPLGPYFCAIVNKTPGAEHAMREFRIVDARRPPRRIREPDFSGDPYGSAGLP